jgi:predicted amidohydrolase YtcJ
MCRICTGDLFGLASARGNEVSRSRFLAGSSALAGLAAAGFASKAVAADAQPAMIFYGGPIITMENRNPNAQAIAISGGKIVAVGTLPDVIAAAGTGSRRVNLDGRTLMPGLIDPHQHPLPGGLMLTQMQDVSYDSYKTKAEVLAALKAKVAQTPSGQWLYAAYYDNVLQGGYLTMPELDRVSTAHNIFVYYVSMHTASGNTAAFKAAGVTASTGELPGGGHFGKNPDGSLNGMIYEMPALLKFLGGFPKLTPQLVGESVTKFLYQSAALGITMVHEAGALAPMPSVFDGYKAIMANSPVRYSVSPMVEYLSQTQQFIAPYGKPGADALEIPGSLLSFYAVKVVSDGSPQQETAFQTQPYLQSNSKGAPNFTAEQMNQMVLQIKRAGWPVSIHTNGDASLDMSLDAIESAYGSGPPAFGINRIEHCSVTRSDQLTRMKRLGIQPSHLMNNVYYYGAAYRDTIFGPERADRFNPAGEFLELGVPFSIHSDCPCSPAAPLREIGTAVTRICAIDGSVVGANQRVPLEAALKGMTIVAAQQCGLGDKTGSLEAGKYADLAILESDPRSVDPSKLGDIKVSETWVNGRKIVIPAS